ncbi:MAG: peroxidase family protein [Methylococcaceae bacterium]
MTVPLINSYHQTCLRITHFITLIFILYTTNTFAFEARHFDGTNNNLTNYSLGSAGTQLIRQGHSDYSDGMSTLTGSTRPGARVISNTIASQNTSITNNRNLSGFAWQWGQFLDHDIDLTESVSPHQSMSIAVPTGDAYFDPYSTGTASINLSRSAYDPLTGTSATNPRQQINQTSSWIDASNVYGSDATRAAALRSFSGGRMATSTGDLLPFNNSGLHNAGGTSSNLFLAGDIRANEQVGLTSMHTLFVREHNRRADQMSAANPTMSDEEIYQRARKIVGAEIQNITYTGFLPALLGNNAISIYNGYDNTKDGTIKNEFSTAAYRFGHTMLPAELQRLDNNGDVIPEGNIDLKNSFFNPSEISNIGIDAYLMGLASQPAQEIDNHVVDGVRNFLFGPPGAGGFDLASMNIERGRDHALADYNQMRLDYGLLSVTDFTDITSDLELQALLFDLYGDVNNIDAWVGGLAEDHQLGSSMGELFSTIIIDQFENLRDADRFWYQNDDFFLNHTELLSEIDNMSLGDIIELNTDIRSLQKDVFFVSVPQPPILWLFATGLLGIISSTERAKRRAN